MIARKRFDAVVLHAQEANLGLAHISIVGRDVVNTAWLGISI